MLPHRNPQDVRGALLIALTGVRVSSCCSTCSHACCSAAACRSWTRAMRVWTFHRRPTCPRMVVTVPPSLSCQYPVPRRVAEPELEKGRLRHQLAGPSRPGRLLPSPRRRHLPRSRLAVEIRQGGPQVEQPPAAARRAHRLLADRNLLHAFDNQKNRVPTVVVAALFQKDPQALIAHPGSWLTSASRRSRGPRRPDRPRTVSSPGWQWCSRCTTLRG